MSEQLSRRIEDEFEEEHEDDNDLCLDPFNASREEE